MKCPNCGHELEGGSGFCEYCGMIISLDEEPKKEKEASSAKRNIKPNFDDDFVEYLETDNTDDGADEYDEAYELDDDAVYNPLEGESVYDHFEQSSDMGFQQTQAEEAHAENEYYGTDESDIDRDDELQPEQEYEEEQEDSYTFEDKAMSSEEEEDLKDRTGRHDEPTSDDEEEGEDDDEFLSRGIKVERSRKKSTAGAFVAMALILVIVVIGGSFAIKKASPITKKRPVNGSSGSITVYTGTGTSTTENLSEATTKSPEITTKKPKETTEKATENTTEKTTKKPSESASATRETGTTAPSATAAKPSTTTPSNSKPSTTVPHTTSPSTTTPHTTAPRVTDPSTSKTTEVPENADKYTIADVAITKPKKYLSKPYDAKINSDGCHLRSGSSISTNHVLYCSYNNTVRVLAQENGFLYIYYPRFGVYGWISSELVTVSDSTQTTKPKTTQGTTITPRNIEPDKTYSKEQTKTVSAAEGLNLRHGPGTDYPASRLLVDKTSVVLKGYSSTASGWVYVYVPSYGVSGWVSPAYLK